MVEEIDIDLLILADNNPRKISESSKNKLKLSILEDPEFLRVRPVLVNCVDGKYHVYAGNQRVTVCKELGYKKIPCIVDYNLDKSVMEFRLIQDNNHYGYWDVDKLLVNFSKNLINKVGINEVKFLESDIKKDYIEIELDIEDTIIYNKFVNKYRDRLNIMSIGDILLEITNNIINDGI